MAEGNLSQWQHACRRATRSSGARGVALGCCLVAVSGALGGPAGAASAPPVTRGPQAAVGAPVSLRPQRLNFGDQPLGLESAPLTARVTNVGHGTLDLGPGSFEQPGTGPAQFALAPDEPPDPCRSTLAAGATCALSFVFTPLGLGPQRAQFRVMVSGRRGAHGGHCRGQDPQESFTVSLGGAGVASDPPAATPEAPSVLLLPASAAGTAGLVNLVSRRRRRRLRVAPAAGGAA